MRAVLCIKPVRAEYVGRYEEKDDELVLNPYDLLALQCLIQYKKQVDLHITCLCMGPHTSRAVLTRCLALGADEAILISDKVFAGSDTYATSCILAKALQKLPAAELYACGEKAVDGETGQVGYSIAARMDMHCVGNVTAVLQLCEDQVVLQTQTDSYTEVIQCEAPLFVVFRGFTTTEELSLLRLKQAQRREVLEWDSRALAMSPSECGQTGSKTKVVGIQRISFSRQAQKIEGTSRQKAEAMLELLSKNM